MRTRTLFALARFLLPPGPALRISAADEERFRRLSERILTGQVTEPLELGASTHRFLRYLVDTAPVLLHGSGNPALGSLEPRDQSDWSGRPIRAVFATSDGIWPLFFATVNRNHVSRLRNNCVPSGNRSHYLFSIDADPATPRSWRPGSVYVLPRATFVPSTHPAEWHSPTRVEPLARLAVTVDDFPLRRLVFRHEPAEPLWRTYARAWIRRFRRAR